MSHVTKIEIEIRDLDALEAACARMGLQLRRDQKTYKWWGHSVGDYPIPAGMRAEDLGKCTHAIHLDDNSYEIGVVEQADGSFRLVFDFYGQSRLIAAVGGQECEGLIGEYTIEAARNAANAQNWVTQDNSDGTLTIYHPNGGQLVVSRDGTVDATGFSGTSCDVATAIEQALGTESERINKATYFEQKARLTATE